MRNFIIQFLRKRKKDTTISETYSEPPDDVMDNLSQNLNFLRYDHS